MVALARTPIRMTIDDFLARNPGNGENYELVDGEPRAMAPAGAIHGFLQNELGSIIRNHLRATASACEVVANPGVIPRLMSAHNVRNPDLGVTCAPLMPGQVMLSDPVLLVEILSPSNQTDTWSNIWTYTTIPSVHEILVLDSTRIAAEMLRRAADATWPDGTEQARDGNLHLASIDLVIPLAELYARTGLKP